jgi:hypothetical protein
MLERSIANQRSRAKSAAAPVTHASVNFRPVANSGVAKQLADALGADPQQRAELLQIFQEIKTSYEGEARKGGKANNIAAALTFFIAAGSMAYHQTDQPAENVTNALVEILEQEMSASPDFKSMTDIEKQQMHDWLVVTGGFVLVGYLDAVKTKDAKELADYKELADGFFKLVFKDRRREVQSGRYRGEPDPRYFNGYFDSYFGSRNPRVLATATVNWRCCNARS